MAGNGARGRTGSRGPMLRLAYTVALYCAAPFLVGRLLWRGRRDSTYLRRIGERFGLGGRIAAHRGCVWIHAVSVGEVQAAAPIVKALRSLYPDETIVVTSTTATGAGRVSKAFGGGRRPSLLPVRSSRLGGEVPEPRRAPCRDHHGNRDLAEPAGGVPPARDARDSRQRASLGTLGGGLPQVPRPVRAGARDVAAIAVQSGEDARRIVSIGAPPDIIDVTGSTKFDIPMLASLREEAAALRRNWGSSRGIWIAASTHDGEESQVLDAFEQVLDATPGSLLVLVPRHPERFREVAAYVRRRGFEPVMRSQRPVDCSGVRRCSSATPWASCPVLCGGGRGVRGRHAGRARRTQHAGARRPRASGAVRTARVQLRRDQPSADRSGRRPETVDDAASLGRAVVDYLRDADLRHTTGAKGRAFVEGNRGAGDRVVALISPHLESAHRSPCGR